jgi:hypothetical protein
MFDRAVRSQEVPIEERVERLENELERARVGLTTAIDQLRDASQDQANKAFFDAYANVMEADQQLRAFLQHQLRGGLGMRAWGVAFLALGIILGVAGNILSSYC